MKLLTLPILLITCTAVFAEPATLEYDPDIDNPKVISYLKPLTKKDIGKSLKGVKLSDGTIELRKATLLGLLIDPAKKQHIYTFQTADGVHSYVWIDPKGRPLPIPAAPGDTSGENAHILSGDIYTFSEVGPGDGIVILTGTSLKWLNKLQKSSE